MNTFGWCGPAAPVGVPASEPLVGDVPVVVVPCTSLTDSKPALHSHWRSAVAVHGVDTCAPAPQVRHAWQLPDDSNCPPTFGATGAVQDRGPAQNRTDAKGQGGAAATAQRVHADRQIMHGLFGRARSELDLSKHGKLQAHRRRRTFFVFLVRARRRRRTF